MNAECSRREYLPPLPESEAVSNREKAGALVIKAAQSKWLLNRLPDLKTNYLESPCCQGAASCYSLPTMLAVTATCASLPASSLLPRLLLPRLGARAPASGSSVSAGTWKAVMASQSPRLTTSSKPYPRKKSKSPKGSGPMEGPGQRCLLGKLSPKLGPSGGQQEQSYLPSQGGHHSEPDFGSSRGPTMGGPEDVPIAQLPTLPLFSFSCQSHSAWLRVGLPALRMSLVGVGAAGSGGVGRHRKLASVCLLVFVVLGPHAC